MIGTLADVDDVIADRFLMEEEPTVDELMVRRYTSRTNWTECHSPGNHQSQILTSIDGLRPR